MKKITFFFLFMITINLNAQDKPYYYEIPDAPDNYTAANVAARLVDGLGFRYYWATEGLTVTDISYRPSEESRTILETLVHIDGLTKILLNALYQVPTKNDGDKEKLSFAELRLQTLEQIKTASQFLKEPDADLEQFDIIFERGYDKTNYPFWNLINGPISDALWHVGQVVSFRRSSGNPLPKGVNVLQGTKTE